MATPSYGSTRAIVDAIAAEFTARGVEAEVHIGRAALARRKDARVGQIVIIPAEAQIVEPRFRGNEEKFSLRQTFAVHVIAKAPQNVEHTHRQYADDLAQAEELRNVFLYVAGRRIPGVLEGASQVFTEAGENSYGVELILSVTARIDSPDATYAPQLAPADVAFDASCAFVGPNETVECCEAEAPTP